MPSIKEVKNRIGSVKSTQQLTKAMKMVAAAKLKKAQDKVLQLRPYSKKLNEILSNLSDSINNELFKERNVNKVLVVIVSSDKGLCGGFNSSLIKEFKSFSNDNNFNNITVLPIGKKAYDFFKNSCAPFPGLLKFKIYVKSITTIFCSAPTPVQNNRKKVTTKNFTKCFIKMMYLI